MRPATLRSSAARCAPDGHPVAPQERPEGAPTAEAPLLERAAALVRPKLPDPPSELQTNYPNLAPFLRCKLPSGATLEALLLSCRDHGEGVPEQDLVVLTTLLRYEFSVQPNLVADLYNALTRQKASLTQVRAAEFDFREDGYQRTGNARTAELAKRGYLRGAPTVDKVLHILAGGGEHVFLRAQNAAHLAIDALRATEVPDQKQWETVQRALRAREEARLSPATQKETYEFIGYQWQRIAELQAELLVLMNRQNPVVTFSEEAKARLQGELSASYEQRVSDLLDKADALKGEAREALADAYGASGTKRGVGGENAYKEVSRLRLEAQRLRRGLEGLTEPEFKREVRLLQLEIEVMNDRLQTLVDLRDAYDTMPSRTFLERLGWMATLSPLRLGVPGLVAAQGDVQLVQTPTAGNHEHVNPFHTVRGVTPGERAFLCKLAFLIKSTVLALGGEAAWSGHEWHREGEVGPVIPLGLPSALQPGAHAAHAVEEALVDWLGHSTASETFAHAISHNVAAPHAGFFVMQGSPMGTRVSVVVPLVAMLSLWTNGMLELQLTFPWFTLPVPDAVKNLLGQDKLYGGSGVGIGVQHPAIANSTQAMTDGLERLVDMFGSGFAWAVFGLKRRATEALAWLNLIQSSLPQYVTGPIDFGMRYALLGELDHVETMFDRARTDSAELKGYTQREAVKTIQEAHETALRTVIQVIQKRLSLLDDDTPDQLRSELVELMERAQAQIMEVNPKVTKQSLQAEAEKATQWAQDNPLLALGFRHNMNIKRLQPEVVQHLTTMATASRTGDYQTLQDSAAEAMKLARQGAGARKAVREIQALHLTALKVAFLAMVTKSQGANCDLDGLKRAAADLCGANPDDQEGATKVWALVGQIERQAQRQAAS